jgi:ligand-binding sensor domain-containing protein/class 3 adenylate cyclase
MRAEDRGRQYVKCKYMPCSLKLKVSFILCCWVFTALYALDPEKNIKQLTHEAWTNETSLPQVSVQAIIQTRDGYLWLGTQEGLVRFDGAHFVQMNSEDVNSFCEDREGGLWVSSPEAGVCHLKEGKIEQFGTARGLSNNRCNSLWLDSEGALWIATDLGVNRLKDGKFTVFTKKDGLPSDQVTAVVGTRGGIIWIGTPEGLARLENGRIQTYTKRNGLTENSIGYLLESGDGTLWIGTRGGGLCAFRKEKFQSYGAAQGLIGSDVRMLFEDRDGNLWIGSTSGGLTKFRDGRMETYTVKEGLSDDTVWSIYEDREGSLWVGTFGGGLNRFKEAKFSTYDVSAGLSNDSAWTVFEDSNRTVWIGTEGGLNSYKDGKYGLYTQKDGLPSNSITSVLQDRDGAIWVGTDGGGISRFKDGRFTNFGIKDGLTSMSVYSLYEDEQGTIWIATSSSGLNFLKNGKISAIRKGDGLSDDFVRAILEDRQGNLWVGTNGGGLNCLRNGKFSVMTEKDGLSSTFIRTLYEDRDGSLWIGTRGGGLNRYRDGRFDVFRMSDGLLSDIIFQILEDREENLWMSCNKGIFRVPKKSLEDFAAKKIPVIPCASFGRSDGMKNSECTGGTQPAGWKSRDGKLWFCTISGVVSIDPSHIRSNGIPPPVVIEEVRVDGKSADLSKEVTAPAGSDRFEFQFAGLSFLAPEKVRFKYFLEGHDKDWIDLEAGRERMAFYTNIPPGRYTFHVKACNNDGLWNEQGASLAFRLKPQFHQTWLFYLLVVLATLVLGGLIYHFTVVALRNFRVGKSLARYHSRHVIENLKSSSGAGSALSTERKRLTIMFGDLTGFSAFSDRCEPEVVDRVINEYLTAMAEIIESRGGTIARFMGDGIMAFFGAPAKMEPGEQAKRAVESAVFMQKRMTELEKKWLSSGIDHTLKLRVGVSQDYATVGNMGSSRLMEYTALGSAVNLAARLETGCTPGHVLVSFPVYVATKELYPYDEPVMREFKGFARQVNVAELDPSKVS